MSDCVIYKHLYQYAREIKKYSKMVLKLYLYDSTEKEIGWVTADPYEYSVDPNIENDFEETLKEKFEDWEVIVEWGGSSSHDSNGHTTTQTCTALDDLTPAEHLLKISDRLEFFYCDSTEIIDE